MTTPSKAPSEKAFPVLDVSQIAKLRPFGKTRKTYTDEVLIEIGDDIPGLFVVLEGHTRIVDRANDDRVIRTSGPGEFNGELGILTGQRAFIACLVSEPGTILFVPSAKVLEIIANIPELSDILVTAFAARRQLLMHDVVASLTIIGPENDSEVLHLLEFSRPQPYSLSLARPEQSPRRNQYRHMRLAPWRHVPRCPRQAPRVGSSDAPGACAGYRPRSGRQRG